MGKNDIREIKVRVTVLSVFAFLALSWGMVPESVAFRSPAVCIHFQLFGVPCPFCGLMRASYLLMHLRFTEAWMYNPLIYYIGWLYLVHWAILLPTFNFKRLIVISWWTGLGLTLLLYGLRLGGWG